MTQERFFELVYAWKDGDLTGDELYQRVFVLSNVVGRSELLCDFIMHYDSNLSLEDAEMEVDTFMQMHKHNCG